MRAYSISQLSIFIGYNANKNAQISNKNAYMTAFINENFHCINIAKIATM
jgi:hypothetical protein